MKAPWGNRSRRSVFQSVYRHLSKPTHPRDEEEFLRIPVFFSGGKSKLEIVEKFLRRIKTFPLLAKTKKKIAQHSHGQKICFVKKKSLHTYRGKGKWKTCPVNDHRKSRKRLIIAVMRRKVSWVNICHVLPIYFNRLVEKKKYFSQCHWPLPEKKLSKTHFTTFQYSIKTNLTFRAIPFDWIRRIQTTTAAEIVAFKCRICILKPATFYASTFLRKFTISG